MSSAYEDWMLFAAPLPSVKAPPVPFAVTNTLPFALVTTLPRTTPPLEAVMLISGRGALTPADVAVRVEGPVFTLAPVTKIAPSAPSAPLAVTLLPVETTTAPLPLMPIPAPLQHEVLSALAINLASFLI